MKTCYVCNVTKKHSEFYKDKSRYDGFANKCKICESKRVRIRIRLDHSKHQANWVKNNPKKYEAHKFDLPILKSNSFRCS